MNYTTLRREHVTDAVRKFYNIGPRDFLGDGRRRGSLAGRSQSRCNAARKMWVWIVRDECRLSYPELARRMGLKSHSNAMTDYTTATHLADTVPEYRVIRETIIEQAREYARGALQCETK